MQKPSLLVVFEGIDGTGKKTESELLEKYITSRGLRVSHFSYPDYDSEYGRRIWAYLHEGREMEVEELFFNYLIDMVKDREKITRDLRRGNVVLIDRYYFSTVAYQSAGGFDYAKAKLIEKAVALPKPDLVLYFVLPTQVAMSRKRKQMQLMGRAADRHERDADLQKATDFYYKKMIKENFGAKKWIVLDASESVEKVNKKVVAAVGPLLSKIGAKAQK